MLRTACMFLLALSPLAAVSTHSAPCATGDMTITASFPNDPGFEGLYKYAVTGSWDTGAAQGLSHISFLYELECACICEAGSFATFDSPAGTASGVDSLGNPCAVDFLGLLECQGDPTISSTAPAIKFETPDGLGCETGNTGSGTWCFYSALSPLPAATYSDAVVVKFSNQECSGDLTGQLPDCDMCGPVPVEPSTWGKLKQMIGLEP